MTSQTAGGLQPVRRACAASSPRSRRRPTSRSTSRPASRASPADELSLHDPRVACGTTALPAARSTTASAPVSTSCSRPSAGGAGVTDPRSPTSMFAAFGVMRDLHELLWYLDDASRPSRRRAAAWRGRRLPRGDRGADPAGRGPALAAVDTGAAQAKVAPRAHRRQPAGPGGSRRARRTSCAAQDLFGKDLSGGDLRAANLRGSFLIRAVLRGADLRLADLIGADLRGADVAVRTCRRRCT